MLQVENLGVRFGGQRALDGVTLSAVAGEVLIVSGPSGCGKSTLARCLSGLIPHNSSAAMTGCVRVDGLDTRTHPVWKVAERVGLVLQHPESQLFNLTVEEEVAFGPRNLGLPAAEVGQRVESALASLGLERLRRRSPATLSAGEKQCLAIAAALAMGPRLLVLDEALAGLDVTATHRLAQTIGRLAGEEGAAVVLLEHKPGELLRLASRMILLDEGRIVAEGGPQEILGQRALVRRLGLRRPASERQQAWRELVVPVGLTRGETVCHREYPRVPGILCEAEKPAVVIASGAKQSPNAGRGLLRSARNDNVNSGLLLELRGVVAGYGREMVLRGVDLALAPGEMTALVGPNGAGKSTLARVMAGLLPVRGGRVCFAGAARRPRPGREVALLLESPDEQLFCDTVAEEVRFGVARLGSRGVEAAEQALAATGLDGLRSRSPHTLSLGQRQRTALAALLALRPQLLILDEPTLGQDWGHLGGFMDAIRQLNAGGMTVLIITHDYKLVHQYARRIVLLEEGKVVAEGDVKRET